jgi:hypothetical protein
LTTTTTYYAQARNSTTNCVSAARAAVTATVNAVPTIARSGGNASQTVDQNTAITTITYTASNATGIALSTGSLPAGVTGTANGLVFTISGTPSATGTFNYGITASHTNGCKSSASSGAITVNAVVTGFYSASTWSYGGYTWSDRVVAKPTGCSLVTTLSSTASANPPAQYLISSASGVERYYYNWTCALSACPRGWSLPNEAQFHDLVSATANSNMISLWGSGGLANAGTIEDAQQYAYYWSDSEHIIRDYYAYCLTYSGSAPTLQTFFKFYGLQVRCIK